jgi:hypothetical protein
MKKTVLLRKRIGHTVWNSVARACKTALSGYTQISICFVKYCRGREISETDFLKGEEMPPKNASDILGFLISIVIRAGFVIHPRVTGWPSLHGQPRRQ